jgi:bilirubin oxidase
VIHANGVPWPYLNVEPRKYRFRLLDASVSRTYKLDIRRSNGDRIPMVVVAADSGYIPRPVSTDTLILANAERYEIIVDFTNFAGQTLTMRNARDFARNEDFTNTNYVMEFRVGRTVTSGAGNGPVPSTLRPATFPSKTTVDHEFSFERTQGEWRV